MPIASVLGASTETLGLGGSTILGWSRKKKKSDQISSLPASPICAAKPAFASDCPMYAVVSGRSYPLELRKTNVMENTRSTEASTRGELTAPVRPA